MQLNKSPGRDLITLFWYKKLYFYGDKLTELYQSTYVVKNISHHGYHKQELSCSPKMKLPTSLKTIDL